MLIKKEGIFDDIISAATSDVQPQRGNSSLEAYLNPHTLDDLYEAILYRLRSFKGKGSKKDVYEYIMPIFFPTKGKKADLSKIPKIEIKGDNGESTTVSVKIQLIEQYRQKFEDIIIDYIASDGMDIVNRVQKSYKAAKGKVNNNDITADQYFGTIIAQLHSGQYDIQDKLVAMYQQFKKDAKKKQWQTTAKQNDPFQQSSNKIDPELTRSMNKLFTQLQRKYPQLSQEMFQKQLAQWLTEEVAFSFLSQMIGK